MGAALEVAVDTNFYIDSKYLPSNIFAKPNDGVN
jgi:hypothetical protein